MSLHILSRRIRPLPYLRHSLQHAHFDGYRFMLESQWLSNSVAAANLRYVRQFWYDACSRNSKCEYRTWLSACSICKISPLQTRVSGKSWHLLCVQRHFASQSLVEKKSRRILLYLTALIFGMLGCTYAAVPLYRRFCQATGYGGTVQRRESVEEKIARHARDGTVPTREIVVYFNADVSDGMPWKFIPTQREVRVKPGESALAFYTAENRSSTPITGVSTYNVTPMKAAVYFNKIQCFCFEEQRLLPGEQIDMPVFFYIDPEFELDPKMDGINNLILSYTFFKVPEDS